MNLSNILTYLSAVLSGKGTRERITLTDGMERFVFPVTPKDITCDDGQNNKVVNIVHTGEAVIFGMPKARKIQFGSFFPEPSHNYPFTVGDDRSPSACRDLIKKWKEARKPVRLLIPSLAINLAVSIDEFNTRKKDNTGDIYYSITFREYIDLNTPAANNLKQVDSVTGLKERNETMTQPTTAAVTSKAADIVDVAKKAYGDYTHWRRVVESNDLTTLVLNNPDAVRKLVIK